MRIEIEVLPEFFKAIKSGQKLLHSTVNPKCKSSHWDKPLNKRAD